MTAFSYVRARSVAEAVGAVADDPGASFIAGGTNLVDLLKYDVAKPTRLVDIGRLPLTEIADGPDGGLRIGALVSNSDVAYEPRVESRYPLLANAILAGASPQLRNAATTGGNLLQRTRCYYFYDPGTPCNKRVPGTGCPAVHGLNRIHAILGASEHCVATHPSDMCVALAALDARVCIIGPAGERTLPVTEFHRLPGDRPEFDTHLDRDELVTAVELPPDGFALNWTYLKLRDRQSYAFALVSVAAALELEGHTIRRARLALGGVAAKPWRDPAAEASLAGGPADEASFTAAADLVLRGATPLRHNAFKIDLARRAIVRALSQAAAGTPQVPSVKRIR